MEIESSRSARILWTILGLGLAGVFLAGVTVVTVQSGPNLGVIVPAVFPIGLGIATYLYLGRLAWIRVDATEVTYVPPLGSAKSFSRTSVRWIARVPGGRGTSTIRLRDQDNRDLLRIQQGFARADMERLAEYLGAKFTWDLPWAKGLPPGSDQAARDHALQDFTATMTPEERAEILKHMKKSDGRS